ncbi:uncharacterized protein LOC100824367 isoform X2 [Brachypodium distachyon]|uniref:Ribosomal RNA small subunit methyltransferase G n=1 Tax=Brachypodium distachyon TaxID=15368 RepID=A0A0Q3NMR9_BRADI|nr:uncharacterized protein LOC100824367 isoform X2 [Brachypodium distachyon]KQK18790.1 hypothetical protein BRADI_1g44700v3 [Brachypodium distachyon]|eukprot:XP_024314380.1 uncharacterized protein LOC100824367 isoform X2 [Brachypodium distachyon]
MSLCCCSGASRRLLLPRLFLGQQHQVGRSLLQFRATSSAAASSSATPLSPAQQRQVTLYVDALLDWNQRMNLTAVTDEAEVMTRHVEDSLAVLPPLERAYRAQSTSHGGDMGGISLIDVGSGAGLPGLILAVARPSWKITLLESMRKRCTFLEHAVEVMELSNVDVLCDRAENVGQSHDFREAFDVAAARAVAELKILAEYCLPLVRVGGLFIAAKGHDPHDEIRNAKAAVHTLGASMLDLCTVCDKT